MSNVQGLAHWTLDFQTSECQVVMGLEQLRLVVGVAGEDFHRFRVVPAEPAPSQVDEGIGDQQLFCVRPSHPD
jgi:hypothetical protein